MFRKLISLAEVNMYAFNAVHYLDSSTKKMFVILYDESTSEIEIFDVEKRRKFLSKSYFPLTDMSLFAIGSKVTIFSRLYEIVSYQNVSTREFMEQKYQRSFAFIAKNVAPDLGIREISGIISSIEKNGFQTTNMRFCNANGELLSKFTPQLGSSPRNDMKALLLEVCGEDSISKMRKIVEDGLSGNEPSSNVDKDYSIYTAVSAEAVASDSAVFEDIGKYTGSNDENGSKKCSTLCILLPQLFQKRQIGECLDLCARSSMSISQLRQRTFTKSEASNFLVLYKGVVENYMDMFDLYSSGPLIGIELFSAEISDSNKLQKEVKSLCGPRDPAIASKVSPSSLRAKYGDDPIRNGVYCTDILKEAPRDLALFFHN